VPVVALAFVQNPMHRSLAALDVAPPEDFSAGPGPYSDFQSKLFFFCFFFFFFLSFPFLLLFIFGFFFLLSFSICF
jgi:hypothetical protein